MIASEFEYLAPLRLVRHLEANGQLFYLNDSYRVRLLLDGFPQEIVVPAGFGTDLASIPKAVPRWIVDKLDRHIEAAVVHDWLCEQKPWDSATAASIFLAGMEAAGVENWKRKIMYEAVLRFGPQWRNG